MPRPRRLAPAFAAIALLLAACSGAGSTGETGAPDATGTAATTDGAEPTSPPAGGAAAADCANGYLPVAEGNSWTYEMSEPAGAGYTDTVTAVGEDSFTITSDFGQLTKTTEWACTKDGVVALTYGGGPSASLSSGGLQAQFETKDVTGVTLPSDLAPGDRWQQTFEITGRLDAGDLQTKVTGSVLYVLRAGDVESIEVPAGTFEAIAVDTQITLDLKPSAGGVTFPVQLQLAGTQWFAQEVGLVKSQSDGEFFGAPLSSTVQLTSYSVA